MTDHPLLAQRGLLVLDAPPDGAVPVCGPYRPGSEDWMLFRAINDARATGAPFVLVHEQAAARAGGFWGISMWRPGSGAISRPEADGEEDQEATGTPASQVSEPAGLGALRKGARGITRVVGVENPRH